MLEKTEKKIKNDGVFPRNYGPMTSLALSKVGDVYRR